MFPRLSSGDDLFRLPRNLLPPSSAFFIPRTCSGAASSGSLGCTPPPLPGFSSSSGLSHLRDMPGSRTTNGSLLPGTCTAGALQGSSPSCLAPISLAGTRSTHVPRCLRTNTTGALDSFGDANRMRSIHVPKLPE